MIRRRKVESLTQQKTITADTAYFFRGYFRTRKLRRISLHLKQKINNLRRSIVIHDAHSTQDRRAKTQRLPPGHGTGAQPPLHALEARGPARDERDGEDEVPHDGRVRGVGAQAPAPLRHAPREAPRRLPRGAPLLLRTAARPGRRPRAAAVPEGGGPRAGGRGEGLEPGLDGRVAGVALGARGGRRAQVLVAGDGGGGHGADLRRAVDGDERGRRGGFVLQLGDRGGAGLADRGLVRGSGWV
jgi:hypothetical protein